MGIYRYIHFLWHIPYNLIKREKHRNIHEAKINSLVTLKLKILEHKPSRFKRQPYRIHCLCEDTPIDIVYFYARHPVIRSTLPIGKERYVSGKLEFFRNFLRTISSRLFGVRKYLKYLGLSTHRDLFISGEFCVIF